MKPVKKPRLLLEGEFLNGYLKNRMIRKNQNVLTATTGGTGSGKSYFNLSAIENYYSIQFKKPFPIENCCFSIVELMKRLNSGKLNKGEVLILEEAGVNLGSLDFQAKVQKLFTYVLQSFRSLNIAIFFNLPAMSMLNKSARILIHIHFTTVSIDYNEKTVKIKPLKQQMNQQSGKVYSKFPRILIRGKMVSLKRLNYGLPSGELIKLYEDKKFKFVSGFSSDFLRQMEAKEKDKVFRMARDNLTAKQMEVLALYQKGLTQKEIAIKLERSQPTICEIFQAIKKKGFSMEKSLKKKENREVRAISTPVQT